VASAVFYTPVANFASFPSSPSNQDRIEVTDSTGLQSQSIITGIPSGFTGSSDLTMRLEYNSSTSKWEFKQYFAEDPEARYMPKQGGTMTGLLTLSGAPTANLHAATKAYVDSANATQDSTVSTNTSNISTNTSNISTNTSNISTNTSNISTNTSNISTNATAIATKMATAGGTFTGAVSFDDNVIVKGDSTNGSGELTLNCENNSHGIKIKGPPHSAGANYTLTLPDDTGTNGQSLQTNGSGVLSFGDVDLSSNFSTTVTNSIATKMPLAGGTFTGNVDLNDNVKARFGTGDDLQIYHNASDSFIDNTTGDLYIRGVGDDLYLRAADDIYIQPQGSENGVSIIGNGAVEAYYDGSKKFETKSDGVDITGELQCDSLDVDGAATFNTSTTVGGNLASGNSAYIDPGSISLRADSAGGDSSAFVVYRGGTGSNDISVKFTQSGAATFTGSVQSDNNFYVDATSDGQSCFRVRRNGTVKSRLDGDGSAEFAGDPGSSGTTVGNKISSTGLIRVARATDGPVFQGNKTDSSGYNVTINANGSADFAGTITAEANAVAEIETLNSASTITPNFANSCNFTVTLGTNTTIANPSNLTAGQSGSIFIVQDGTGSRTAAFGSYWDFAGGAAPTLTTTANGVDRIDYIVRSSTSIHAVATLAYS
jgi:hypothetical protein